MARVKYYDSTTQTWKYADMALQTGIHVGTTAPTNEAMLWVDTTSNQIDDFPLTDVKDGDGNSLIASGTTYAVSETPTNKLKSVSGGGAGITSSSTDTEYPSAKCVYDFVESQGGGVPSGTADGQILVWDNTNQVWTVKPKWQMIYQPVEYIESTGTQYIISSYIPNSNSVIETEMAFVQNVTSRENLSGVSSEVGGVVSRCAFGISNIIDGTKWYIGIGDTNMTGLTNDTSKHKFTINCNTKVGLVDDVAIGTANNFNAHDRYFAFFVRNSSQLNTTSVARMYGGKFSENGVLIGQFVPVRDISTGKGGLYDAVGNKFYGNNGSGSFVIGADVN